MWMSQEMNSGSARARDGYKSAKFLDPDRNEFWLFESSLAKKVQPKSTRAARKNLELHKQRLCQGIKPRLRRTVAVS